MTRAAQETLKALHRRYAAPLKRYFQSYRLNWADAEDLTQDVFVRLAGSCVHTEVLNPNAFIFALARNLLRDRARRLHTKAEARSISFDAIDLRCEAPTPDRSLELVQLLQHVEQALAALNPRAREAFMLHRVHGDSHTEIAAQMDISVSMVEKHIMSAIRLLGSINA